MAKDVEDFKKDLAQTDSLTIQGITVTKDELSKAVESVQVMNKRLE